MRNELSPWSFSHTSGRPGEGLAQAHHPSGAGLMGRSVIFMGPRTTAIPGGYAGFGSVAQGCS